MFPFRNSPGKRTDLANKVKMDSQLDAESYWNRSTSKAFSFDDDDEEQEDSGRLHGTKAEDNILCDDNVSEASFDNTANVLNLTIRSVLSEADLELILNEQSLESNIIPKGITADEELKLLRRKLQYSSTPSLKVTASELLLGKLCPLEVFKSLSDKEELLDEVLRNGDGSSVTGVILFLHKTLNKKQFYRILRNRSKASDHYINYLIQTKNKDAVEVLTMLGRHQESAMLQFKAALHSHSDIQTKKQRLKQFLGSYLADPGMVPVFNQIFTNSLNLIQLIESEKDSLGHAITADSSALEVLYSCCAKHKWKDNDTTNPLSPFKISTDHQISAAQFEWTALNERAKSQSYLDLGGIFEKSSWHSITKQKQFHISFSLETAIQRLADLQAPSPVLHLFLSKLNSPSQKLVLSKKVKCAKATVDALAALKDTQELELFRESLADSSEERFYCEQALKNINKKWSADGLKIIR